MVQLISMISLLIILFILVFNSPCLSQATTNKPSSLLLASFTWSSILQYSSTAGSSCHYNFVTILESFLSYSLYSNRFVFLHRLNTFNIDHLNTLVFLLRRHLLEHPIINNHT